MTDLHPAATHHLPSFITPPGQGDFLLGLAAATLIVSVLLIGALFFWLHSLPERMAHRHHKLQIELIAVLCLLSLFTHVHLFWVIALVLAFVKVPEIRLPHITGTLEKMAGSLDKIAAASATPIENAPPATAAAGASVPPAAAPTPAKDSRKPGQRRI